jgi:hypothetical protein
MFYAWSRRRQVVLFSGRTKPYDPAEAESEYMSMDIVGSTIRSPSIRQDLLDSGHASLRYFNQGSADEAEAEIRAAIREDSWYPPIRTIRFSPFSSCLHRDSR